MQDDVHCMNIYKDETDESYHIKTCKFNHNDVYASDVRDAQVVITRCVSGNYDIHKS